MPEAGIPMSSSFLDAERDAKQQSLGSNTDVAPRPMAENIAIQSLELRRRRVITERLDGAIK
jgi:hypothetical protein